MLDCPTIKLRIQFNAKRKQAHRSGKRHYTRLHGNENENGDGRNEAKNITIA